MGLYQLKHIQKSYDGRVVLQLDNLTVERGEKLAIVGPSGAGKSTLLRLLAFLERPDRGELIFNGRQTSPTWPDLPTRRQVTMVFQRPQLLRRSVYENVAYGLRLRGRRDAGTEIDKALSDLGLSELSHTKAHKLSGGELQRVALARAMVLQPQVLLLDEPTANLDPYNIRLIEEKVLAANELQGMSVVIVTHNIFQAQRMADRVALLLNGSLIEIAPAARFFEAPQDSQTRAFLSGEILY